MRSFNAPHVVKLIGYCTKTRPLLVVMEYMLHGDLKKFLQRNRPPTEVHDEKNATIQKGSYTTVAKTILHQIRPVHQMAIEIADGMLYLEDMKFIHCDLACRNLMVHENYIIKIGGNLFNNDN
jgi:serine/threonine protein kinase